MKDDRSLSPRVRVHAQAKLIDDQGNEIPCVLMDLSVDGFRAELVAPHDPKSFRKLDTKRRVYPIEVRWDSGLELCGKFL